MKDVLEKDKGKDKEKFDVFASMESYLKNIDGNISKILEAMDQDPNLLPDKKKKELSLEETQTEVLDTLQGFFVNQ